MQGNTRGAQDAANLYKSKTDEAIKVCRGAEEMVEDFGFETAVYAEAVATLLAQLNKDIKGINRTNQDTVSEATSESEVGKCPTARNKILRAVINKSDNVTAEQAVIDFTSTEVGLLAVLRASECDGDPQDSTDKIMMGILKQKEIDGTIKATKAKWIVDIIAAGQEER